MPLTSRRAFVRTFGLASIGLIAAACGPAAPASTSTASTSSSGASPTSAPTAGQLAAASQAVGSSASPVVSPASAAPAVTRPPVTVRITDIQIASAAGSYIAAEKGYFKEEGIDAQFVQVPTADQVTAIVSDSADVAGAAINAQLFNALARGLPIKMMADHGANLKDASAGGLVLRKDLVDSGAYKTPTDLKGQAFGVGSPAGTQTSDIALEKYLGTFGMSEADLDMQILGFPDMIPAFASKRIAACYWQEPFTTIGLSQGLVTRGPIAFDMYPNQQIAVLVFGRKLQSDRDLSLRHLRAYTRGVRDYVKALILKQPAAFEEVVPILIQHTTVKDHSIFERAIPSGLKPDPLPNVQSIRDDLAWFVQKGTVGQTFDLEPYIDIGLIQEAIGQVGPFSA